MGNATDPLITPSYEIFDHTADAGLRVRAATMAGLLAPAGIGLYDIIGRLVPCDPSKPLLIDLKDHDASFLLRDYLAELLILFEQERSMVTGIEAAALTDTRLTATLNLARVDERQSEYHREVKAITYHELAIDVIPGGYEATIIVDI